MNSGWGSLTVVKSYSLYNWLIRGSCQQVLTFTASIDKNCGYSQKYVISAFWNCLFEVCYLMRRMFTFSFSGIGNPPSYVFNTWHQQAFFQAPMQLKGSPDFDWWIIFLLYFFLTTYSRIRQRLYCKFWVLGLIFPSMYTWKRVCVYSFL